MQYKFTLTPVVVRYLQAIERVRERIHLTLLPPAIAEELRLQAHIRSTHYSTRIEGNHLTLKETEEVIQQGRLFPGRERDVLEVERYYQAVQQMEMWVDEKRAVTEERLRKLHAILYHGRRARPTPYRDGQNVIREQDGHIVYIPPEAKDVPGLMAELVAWINQSSGGQPVPVIAGIAHYMFETIHPYYDGNGRAGRLLATWILHLGGYDLGKFYALEEFYANDLPGYYNALVTHSHHNFSFGRNTADITPWLEYFLKGMAEIFEQVAGVVGKYSLEPKMDDHDSLLRELDPRARRVAGLFSRQQFIQSSDVSRLVGLSMRQSRELLSQWVRQGWLEVENPSNRARKYRLAKKFRSLVQEHQAETKG
jgi:Fic family protein